jgi:hypothetical protein
MHELAWGDCEVLESDAPPVLVLSYHFRRAFMVTLHNFSDTAQTVRLRLKEPGGRRLVDLIGEEHSCVDGCCDRPSLSFLGHWNFC